MKLRLFISIFTSETPFLRSAIDGKTKMVSRTNLVPKTGFKVNTLLCSDFFVGFQRSTLWFIPLMLLLNFELCAQDLKFTHSIIDTLTSSYMAGRGYVKNGHAEAANYIKNQFESLGLEPIGNSYEQFFCFPINTFPAKMQLEIEGKELVAGKDYLIAADSPAIKGKYKLLYVDSFIKTDGTARAAFFQKDYSAFFLVVDLKVFQATQYKSLLDSLKENRCNAKGIILLEPQKLTWSMSQVVGAYPTIIILREAFLNKAEQIEVCIQNKYIRNQRSQNVIGYVKGTQFPDSFIVFTAHYDHLGMMGKQTYFPGANDNASGVSMLVNLAAYYANPKYKPKFSMVFIAFGAEEVGLIGSRYFTEHPLFPLSNIKFLLNMDLLGTGDDGLMVVNGKIYTDLYDTLVSINERQHYLPQIKSRGKAANSDHYWFSEKGVKSFFIYTLGGISAYHDIYDKADTLPLTKYEELYHLLIDFVGKLE